MALHSIRMYIKALPVHTRYIYIFYECDLLITPPSHTLCSSSFFQNNEENNYHATLQPPCILACFLLRGELNLPPSIYCAALPRNAMANIAIWVRDNTVIERDREGGGGGRGPFKMAKPAVNIWQIREVQIFLESHPLKRKKAKATGTIRRAWQELLHLIAPWNVHYLHFWVTRR